MFFEFVLKILLLVILKSLRLWLGAGLVVLMYNERFKWDTILVCAGRDQLKFDYAILELKICKKLLVTVVPFSLWRHSDITTQHNDIEIAYVGIVNINITRSRKRQETKNGGRNSRSVWNVFVSFCSTTKASKTMMGKIGGRKKCVSVVFQPEAKERMDKITISSESLV